LADQPISVSIDLEQIAEQIVAALKEHLTPDILPPAQLLFTVRDAAAVLGMGQTKVRSLIARGILQTVPVDGMIYVRRESIIALTLRGAEPCRETDETPRPELRALPHTENRKTAGRQVRPAGGER
jgi:DNA-binding transcriptional regulator YhcF (GntR family)